MFRIAAHRSVRLWLPILIVFPAVYVRTARADVYTFQNFDYASNAAPNHTVSQGINNSGQIVGYLEVNWVESFIRSSDGSTYTQLLLPGQVAMLANGINDSGQVTGRVLDATGAYGFLRSSDGSNYTLFNHPSAYMGNTYASGIDNSGRITGYYWNSNAEYHGFLRSSDGSTYTDFDVPLASPGNTFAAGINDAGQIVGYFFDGLRYRGFLRSGDGSNYITLDNPFNPNWTMPTGINDSGEIVGYYYEGGRAHGFVRSSGGTYTTLDDPSDSVPGSMGFTKATGINDSGQITGYYVGFCDGYWGQHGFVATPVTAEVPEPAGILLIGTLLVGLAPRMRRWRGKSR